ncbi:hypothetical protein NUH86_11200 [Sphingobium sp. JS3065]|uniref:hypothetical protein n=1 Tax=Sphingobium sp. JS3065 TaxID=2970925 RepID=UPI0022650B6B|nr:hypothetical protein [Sphingobium sp. JS3065]UZW54097.1 hypothetical protein NUH86_11200 [Sphingobium sp. JS3065]
MTKTAIPMISALALVASMASAQTADTSADQNSSFGAEVSTMAKAQRDSDQKGIGADVSVSDSEVYQA